jgi:hypothetical protein
MVRNHTELNVAVVGGEFTTHVFPVDIGFAVQVLIAGTARTAFHIAHPEVATVGPDGVNRFLLYFLPLFRQAASCHKRDQPTRERGNKTYYFFDLCVLIEWWWGKDSNLRRR